MAGARDIKRETIRRRREQRKRNQEAVEEADRRRSEMEKRAKMTPSERRLWARRQRQRSVKKVRDGHRLKWEEVEEDSEEETERTGGASGESGVTIHEKERGRTEDDSQDGDDDVISDKMDRTGGVPTKADRLDTLKWGSSAALKLARDEGLDVDDFEGVEPGGKTGFVTKDVQALLDE